MSAFTALRSPAYRRVFGTQIIMRLAKYAGFVAIGVLLVTTCRTGATGACATQATAALVAGFTAIPIAGTFIARFGASTTARVALVLGAAVSIVLALLSLYGINSPFVLVVASTALAACCSASSTSTQILETETVDRGVRQSAIGMASLANGLPRLVGLAAGSLIAALAPPPAVFAVVTALLLVGAVVVPGTSSRPFTRQTPQVSSHTQRSVGQTLRDTLATAASGTRMALADPELRPGFIVIVITAAVVLPLDFLLPAVAGASGKELSAAMATFALGGILVGPLMVRVAERKLPHVLPVGVGLILVGFVLVLCNLGTLTLMLALFLVGSGWEAAWTATRCRAQLSRSDADGARVLIGMTQATYALPAVGAMVLGAVFTMGQVFVVLPVLLLTAATVVAARPLWRTATPSVAAHATPA